MAISIYKILKVKNDYNFTDDKQILKKIVKSIYALKEQLDT
jgi:hypothetical protein